MSVEAQLKKMGIVLPLAPKPVGSYVPIQIAGNLVFVSGQISKDKNGEVVTGRMGHGLSLEQGNQAARMCALSVLSALKEWVGLDRVEQIVRVVGYVQTAPDFFDIPQVINGASDLFVQVFGEKGRHARSAVGASSLPMNAVCEIEAIILLKNQGGES